MPTRRTLLRWGAGLGVGALALPGCSGVAGTGTEGGQGGGATTAARIKLAWWGGPDRAKRTQEVAKLFEQANEGVTIAPSFTDFGSYFRKINTEAAGGGLPDVLQLGDIFVGQYAHNNQLLDLGKYVDDKTIDVTDFEESVLRWGKVDDKYYAIPLAANMPSMIYNKTLIEKAGIGDLPEELSWDELVDYARKLKPKLPKGVWPLDPTNSFYVCWIRQRVPDEYSADNQIAYQPSHLEEWFRFWDGLRKEDLTPTPSIVIAAQQNGTSEASPLVQGKTAIGFQWSNFLGQYQILTDDELDIRRYPTGGSGTSHVGDFVQASQFFGVSAKSKQPEVAAKFVHFFTHDPAALKILGVERGVPVSAAARDVVEPTLKPYDARQVEFFNAFASKARPKSHLDPENASAVSEAMLRASQAIMLGNAAIPAAVAKFFEEATKALRP
jgi:multiple sugar transport system substrate-binding protein